MIITTLAAGEISKKLYGRVDLALYMMGAGKVENFEVIGTGGITRRPGTQRMGELAGPARLIPFVINPSTSFLFEIGAGYIRIWKDGDRLEVDGDPVEFVSTETIPLYASLAEAREVHFAQTYREVYLVHRSYPPYKIEWTGGTTFTLSRISFTGNLGEVPFQGAGNYPGTIAFFGGRLFLGGTLTEPQKIWASQPFEYENFTQYETISTETSKIKDPDLRIFTATSAEGSQILTGVTQDFTSLSANILVKEDVHAIKATGTKGSNLLTITTGSLADITNPTKYYVSGPGVATGTRVRTIDGATIELDNQLAADSTAANFTVQLCESIHSLTDYYVSGEGIQVGTKIVDVTPTTLTMSMGATSTITDRAFTIQLWRSADSASADDYETIYLGNDVTNESSAFFFEIASDKNDAIKWMCPAADLVIGTESAEWVIPAGVNATNIVAVLNTRHGSDGVQAMVVGPAIMFVQQGARAIREYFYGADGARYQATNLALWAPQILGESPALDFDYTTSPSPRLLVTRSDGTVVSLLYEKDQQVQAWYRIKPSSGLVMSTASTPDSSGTDAIWFAVKEGTAWYLERLNDDGDVFLDGYQEAAFSSPTEYTYDVGTYGANAILFNATTGISAQIATIPADFYTDGDVVYIGYQFESRLESLPVIKDMDNNQKKITSLILRLLESDIPYVRVDSCREEHPRQDVPYSGVIKVPVESSWDRDVIFRIRTSAPRAVTVLAINAEVK